MYVYMFIYVCMLISVESLEHQCKQDDAKVPTCVKLYTCIIRIIDRMKISSVTKYLLIHKV